MRSATMLTFGGLLLAAPVLALEWTHARLGRVGYRGIRDHTVWLRDGRWVGRGDESAATVTLLQEHAAVGDLTGDDRDDAAVLLVEDDAAVTVLYLAVVEERRGTLVNVDTTPLGLDARVEGLEIAGGAVTVEMVERGSVDPQASARRRRTFVLAPSGLEERSAPAPIPPPDQRPVDWQAGEAPAARSSEPAGAPAGDPPATEQERDVFLSDPAPPPAIEGVEWVLAEMGVGGQVAVGVVISVRFADGRMRGSAGCNSYVAPYRLEGERLTVTSIAATRRMCPDPAMAEERRYFDRLERVRRAERRGDRLWLAYGTADDERTDYLVFAPR